MSKMYCNKKLHQVDESGRNILQSAASCVFCPVNLKEYYEIVDEARPLSGIFTTHADFFTEMHFYSWN